MNKVETKPHTKGETLEAPSCLNNGIGKYVSPRRIANRPTLKKFTGEEKHKATLIPVTAKTVLPDKAE